MSAAAVRAGAAYVELILRDKLTAGLRNASKQLHRFGTEVSKVSASMLAIGGAITAPLVAAAHQIAETGSQLSDMRARTGASTEALSELGYAARLSGSSLEDVERAMVKMNGTVADAAAGSETAQEALDAIGLSAAQLSAMRPEDRFMAIADAVSRLPDPLLMAGRAMDVMGKSGVSLVPLLSKGSREISEMRDEARRLGGSITTGDAAAASQFADVLGKLKTVMLGFTNAVGAAVIPLLTEQTERITDTVVKSIEWIKANRGVVVTVLKVGAALTVAGAAGLVLGRVISGLGTAFGVLASMTGGLATGVRIVGGVIASMMSPIGAVVGGAIALGAAFLYASGAGGDAIEWLTDKFSELKEDATKAWKGIADALASGNIKLAVEIAWLTIKMEWQKGIHFINGLWVGAKNFFMQTWSDAVYGVANVMVDAWASMEKTFADVIAGMGSLIDGLGIRMKSVWNKVTDYLAESFAQDIALFDPALAEATIRDLKDNQTRRDTAEANAAKARETSREEARKNRHKEVDDEAKKSKGNLASAQAEADKKRDEAFAAELKPTEDALRKSQEQWRASLAEAAKGAAAPEGPPEAPGLPKGWFDGSLDHAAKSMKMQQNDLESKGTFNALAARGLGADSMAERQTRAAEEAVALQRRLVQQATRGRLLFAE